VPYNLRPPSKVLLANRLAEPIAAGLRAVKPGLQLRARQMHEVTPDDLAWAEALVGFKRPAAGIGSVRWVHSIGAGVDAFLDGPVWPEDALLTRTSEPFGPAMGEFVLARLFAFAQHLPEFAADQREHRWKPVTPVRLAGTRAVIVGTGEVGRGIAAALGTAGVRITGVSRSGARAQGFEAVKPVAELAALMPFTEWLILAAPLTPETRGLIGPDVLARCHGLRLVNVARGGLVDEPALLAALDAGRVAAAALDVFDQEPLPATSPLWDHPGVFISPHVAGVTTAEGAIAGFLECFAALERGHRPRLEVDPARGY
jgi:phosphoglycerate dehydrogenase-like enzyme